MKINHEDAAVRTSRIPTLKSLLAIGVVLLATALLVSLISSRIDAAALSITTTAVDNAQYGIPYSYQLLASSDTSNDPTNTWSITAGNAAFTAAGFNLAASGLITGTPTRATASGGPITFTVQVANGTGEVATRTFTISIAGKSSFYFTTNPSNPSDSAVPAGATNVAVAQFAMKAEAEDIRLNSLKLYGLGSGYDTFDVLQVKLYMDSNSNGRVDAGEALLKTSTFATDQGYNPYVQFTNIGYIIDTTIQNGYETFLVVYDFKGTVEAGRTFRLALEQIGDVTWSGMTSGYASGDNLGVGSPTNGGAKVITTQLGNGIPYRSGIITISGNPPLVPTLYLSDGGLVTGLSSVASGAVNQVGLPLKLWSDSGHTIVVDAITLYDSGSGLAASQLSSVKLYYDLDKNGSYSATDVFLKTGTISGDNISFSSLSLMVTTLTGLPSDPSAVSLIVVYNFGNNIPVVSPALTFQPILQSAASVTARDNVTQALATIATGTIPGNVFQIVSGTQSSLYSDTVALISPFSVINKIDSVVVWRGRFWADSGHQILLKSLTFTPSGSLEDRYDISAVSLYKDRDQSGSVTSGDVLIYSKSSYDSDNAKMTMSGLNQIISTPTGASSDSNALDLLVVYTLNGNAPPTAGIRFSTAVSATTDVSAVVYDSNDTITFLSGPPLYGRTVVVAGTESTAVSSVGGGPYPISSTFYDADTSGSVNSGDYIIVSFDTNLSPASTATLGGVTPDFVLPVTGDGFGSGASVAFFVGNKMRITIGSGAKITVNGTYAAGAHTTDSPSGINARDTISTITNIYGRQANQASSAVDIGGTLTASGAGTGPAPLTATFADNDGSFSVTRGDGIIVTFTDNITATSVASNAFTFPVTNDWSGSLGQTTAQTGGNRVTITFSDTPVFTVAGVYFVGVHAQGSASGINLGGITSSIKDSSGRSAVPATTAIDIGGLDTGSLDSAPRPSSAVFYDRDTNGFISASDVIDLYFTKNVVLSSLPANKIYLPVLGDYLANATASQVGGNLIRITVGTSAVFKVTGTFASGTTASGSASGINLLSATSGIQDIDGRSAVPATTPLDITAGSSWYNDAGAGAVTSGSGSTPAAPPGDSACAIERLLPQSALLGALRQLRDLLLSTECGRVLTDLYYSI